MDALQCRELHPHSTSSATSHASRTSQSPQLLPELGLVAANCITCTWQTQHTREFMVQGGKRMWVFLQLPLPGAENVLLNAQLARTTHAV
jgi:hypothetical protein